MLSHKLLNVDAASTCTSFNEMSSVCSETYTIMSYDEGNRHLKFFYLHCHDLFLCGINKEQ
jgi:hypothetical protein